MNIFLGYPPENVKQWIIDDYNRKQEEMLRIPLCFEAVDAGATVALYCEGDNLAIARFQTSPDGQNWSDYTLERYDYATIITLTNAGDKVYFRAKVDNTSIERDYSNLLKFLTTQESKKVKVSGNVMSLLAPEFSQMRSVIPYCFCNLFAGNYNITDCGNLTLPATTLAEYCYSNMLGGCSSLTKAPALPATTLAECCYSDMFRACSSLTQAPTIKTYTQNLTAYECMLYFGDYGLHALTACTWNDLTLSEAESMILRDNIFGGQWSSNYVRISNTSKDGSGTAYYDSGKSSWVFEH